MYKVMLETHDSGGEGFCIAQDFDTNQLAWNWWYGESEQYPERKRAWVENQTIVDEFGAEAVANIMGCGDDSEEHF
jgi:hypothetical protein